MGKEKEALQAILASLPPEVRAAVESGDERTFEAAIKTVPKAERQEVLRLMAEAAGTENGDIADMEEVLAGLPPTLRDALESFDEETFYAALEALTEEERQDALQRLQDAGIIDDVDAGMEEVLASLPPAVRAALEADDDEAFYTAVEALPEDEQQDILQQLQDAGIISEEGNPDMEEVVASLPRAAREAIESDDEAAFKAALEVLPLAEQEDISRRIAAAAGTSIDDDAEMEEILLQFEPLLQAVAAIGLAESGGKIPDAFRESLPEMRPQVEADLEDLEQDGWCLREAAKRIWAGERDADALTDDLDEEDTQLIERVLELIASKDPGGANA